MTISPICVAQWGGILILTICFLQSGIDKILNYKGNLEWLTGHFSKSIFKNSVPLLLVILTILEVVGGGMLGIGAVVWALYETSTWIMGGLTIIMISLVCLFLGQRLAQDYAGAGGLIPYVLLTAFTLYLFAA